MPFVAPSFAAVASLAAVVTIIRIPLDVFFARYVCSAEVAVLVRSMVDIVLAVAPFVCFAVVVWAVVVGFVLIVCTVAVIVCFADVFSFVAVVVVVHIVAITHVPIIVLIVCCAF